MKILHIIPSYFPAYRHGGPVLSVHTINKWLTKLGVDVTVYTTNIDGSELLDVPLNEEVDVDGVKVFYFPLSFKIWEYSTLMHKALKKNLKNFDLVHITSVFLSASALGSYYAKQYGVPYLISPRGSLMKEPLSMKSPWIKKIYLSLIEKENLKNAWGIHFTVEREKEEYEKASLPLQGGIVIPNAYEKKELGGENPSIRERLGIYNPDWKIILFLGRINWKKGLDTLIPAFSEVLEKDPDVVLVVAGGNEEKYREKVESWVSEYGLERRVIFPGMLLGEEKEALLEESHVFVLPSYSENFGMAVVESLAFKTPVVVTPQVGVSPWVKESGSGIVVNKDPDSVAQGILSILKDPEKAKDMGEKGARLVEEVFKPQNVAKRFLRVYKEIKNTKT